MVTSEAFHVPMGCLNEAVSSNLPLMSAMVEEEFHVPVATAEAFHAPIGCVNEPALENIPPMLITVVPLAQGQGTLPANAMIQARLRRDKVRLPHRPGSAHTPLPWSAFRFGQAQRTY